MGPDDEHTRPDGVDDLTVEALGDISEALEAIEIARGHLYNFHRLSGTADLTLGKGVAKLREAGHADLADRFERDLVGRNVLYGRWTFQVVEEYDEGYYAAFKDLERAGPGRAGRRSPASLRGRDEGGPAYRRPARPRGAAGLDIPPVRPPQQRRRLRSRVSCRRIETPTETLRCLQVLPVPGHRHN